MTMKLNAPVALAVAASIGVAACEPRDRGNSAANNVVESAQESASNQEAAAVVTGGVADPQAWVMNKYVGDRKVAAQTSVAADETANSQKPEYSPRLRALFAEEEKYARGEVGRLGFDFTTGAQDDDISDVKVTWRDIDGAPRKAVTANFVNMGKPVEVVYYFEKIGDAWFLDDVASPGYGGADGTPPWTLSLVLKYG